MNIGEIRDEVLRHILEGSFEADYVETIINRGIRAVTKKVLTPALERATSVDTEVGNTYITMPSDYGHNLFAASSEDGPITVFTNSGLMLQRYPMIGVSNKTGPIKAISMFAETQAIIHPVPTEITSVHLFYYTFPTELAEGDSVDPYITDEDAQEDLLINFALWKLYKKVEDEDGDAMSNTKYHYDAFNEALKAYQADKTHGQSRPLPFRQSEWKI